MISNLETMELQNWALHAFRDLRAYVELAQKSNVTPPPTTTLLVRDYEDFVRRGIVQKPD